MSNPYPAALIKLRAKNNLSQQALAGLLGVSFSSVNRWERGRFEPTLIAKERLRVLFKENGIALEGGDDDGK
jgi:DNA-binding transcriptional regulator YiaG